MYVYIYIYIYIYIYYNAVTHMYVAMAILTK